MSNWCISVESKKTEKHEEWARQQIIPITIRVNFESYGEWYEERFEIPCNELLKSLIPMLLSVRIGICDAMHRMNNKIYRYYICNVKPKKAHSIPELFVDIIVGDDCKTVSANEEAIEALETVRIEELCVKCFKTGLQGPCVICFESLSAARSELKKLPCSHWFHGDCIVPWLHTSRFCPLCRHPI